MRTTRLFIKKDKDYEEIDLFDDIIIPITLKVLDFKNFGSKSSSYSSDIDIPHTAHNSQVFGIVEEINAYDASFEMARNYDAYVELDGLNVFQGMFRLKKVFKKRAGDYVYYQGCLFSDTKNFVDKLGNKTLVGNEDPTDDLDFSDYWTPSDEMTLAYFAEYLQTHYTDGTGWGLTVIDKTDKASQNFVSGRQEWYTDEMTPYLYAREIFQRLFRNTGFSFESEFLEGTDFSPRTQYAQWKDTIGKFDVNSIIYPYMRHNSNIHSPNPISSVITQIDSNATADMVYRNYDITTAWATNDVDNIQSYFVKFNTTGYRLDESNMRIQSQLTNYGFTAPEPGTYVINVEIPIALRMNLAVRKHWPDRIEPLTAGTIVENRAHRFDQYSTDDDFSGTLSYVLQFEAMRNGGIAIGEGIDVMAEIPDEMTVENNNGQVTLYEGTFSYQRSIVLNRGDTFSLNTYISIPVFYHYYEESVLGEWHWARNCCYITQSTNYNPEPTKVWLEAKHSQNDTIISIENAVGFYEEAPFDPTAILNPKTTKLNYFKNFMKMFNLYVEDVSGKMNYKTGELYRQNTLRIEPYEMYYTPEIMSGLSNTHDWTNKIDWDSVEYRRVDDYLYNIQNFTKEQDGDVYNADYNATYKLPHGNREIEGPYCTSDDRNQIDLKVSASLCGVVNSSTDVLQCPKVFAKEKSNSVDMKKEYSDGLFFIWNNDMSTNTSLRTNYTLRLMSRIHTSVNPVEHTNYETIRQYYCADYLNKGYGTDSACLNWGPVSAFYQNLKDNEMTKNDLYNAFYRKQYVACTAEDSRIMTANIYLSAYDIATLQLSDTIVIGDNFWHILQIKEWRDNDRTPCEIELIKVIPEADLSKKIKPTEKMLVEKQLFDEQQAIIDKQ